MASTTKTYTENMESSYKSTWTFVLSANDIIASGNTFALTAPTVTAKYVYSGKNRAEASIDSRVTINGSAYWFTSSRNDAAWASGTTYTLSNTAAKSVATSDLFTSSNKTTRSVPLTYYVSSVWGWSYKSGGTMENFIRQDTFSPFSVVLRNVTLNAPPTFDNGAVSFDTSQIYTGLTTASVSVSNLAAQYGGDISEVKFTIGNQSVTRTNAGTLSILLNEAGTFTPTISVKDSRGQVSTKTLTAITVNGYTAPAVSFTVERAKSTGVPDDEGVYAVAAASFTYTSSIATLQAPTVKVNGTAVSPTWYSTRASNGTLSGSVNWSSPPDTVYALINGSFSTQLSYQIGITPKDNKGTGSEITQTLTTAFYTIDFLAGGHGIAFGKPASEEGFDCNIPAKFEQSVSVKDNSGVMRTLLDFFLPVGSYYETSNASFDPNTIWGGTWVREIQGQVHVSAGANYPVTTTNVSAGGEATHTLTVNEIPSHRHTMYGPYSTGSGSSAGYMQTNNRSTTTVYGGYAGGGGAHNNMQPYRNVHRWWRTA